MKTISPSIVLRAHIATVPLERPRPEAPRPVRRGNFWPGESFVTGTRKWDLTGAVFADQAFVLPALVGPHDS